MDLHDKQQFSVIEEKLVMKQEKKRKNNTKKKSSKKNKMEKEYNLVAYDELPEYMKENEYIRGYYRSEWPISHAFLSLFSWHNETINIWTHLIGFLTFLGFTLVHLGHVPGVIDLLGNLPWSISLGAVDNNTSCNQANLFSVLSPLLNMDQSSSRESTMTARWPFFVFLSGSMFCLLSSTSCHLLCCHSHGLNLFLNRLDYTGIAVMIVTSFFPPIYYIFQCQPFYQAAYLTTISVFGFLTVLTLLSPELTKGRFRSYRAMLFVAMALFGVIPAVHATVVNWSEPRRNVTLAYEGLMAGSYLVGTAFYVSRVPERWRPGWFDLTGSSHQIFHLLVMCGALAHYAAGLVFLEFRDAVGCNS